MKSIFASNLRIKKEEYNLTQEQIAIKLRRKKCTVAAWLEGRAEPGLNDQARLIEMFDIKDWKTFITKLAV